MRVLIPVSFSSSSFVSVFGTASTASSMRAPFAAGTGTSSLFSAAAATIGGAAGAETGVSVVVSGAAAAGVEVGASAVAVGACSVSLSLFATFSSTKVSGTLQREGGVIPQLANFQFRRNDCDDAKTQTMKSAQIEILYTGVTYAAATGSAALLLAAAAAVEPLFFPFFPLPPFLAIVVMDGR
ncbi:hypothetical protein BDW71DRAFT_97139 [Aspergillus fruticulosus]